MNLTFRQGIIRYQKDPQGTQTFLQRAGGGASINLLAGTDPTLVTIAHGSSNYLIEERTSVIKAWSEFTAGRDSWLYIDLDQVTGQRTFGYTTVAPTYGNKAPLSPVVDQHWFDTTAHVMCMKVFNGSTFVPVLRVFLARYQNGVSIVPYNYGTQINVNVRAEAGHLVFDAEGRALRAMISRTYGEFFTTASVFTTTTSKSANVTMGALCTTVRSAEPIPAFSLVSRGHTADDVILADTTVHDRPAVGMIQEDLFEDEVGIYTTHGYVTNESWNWTQSPGSPLFLGETGQISLEPSQRHTMQQIGYIVGLRTIMLDIRPQVHYDGGQSFNNLVPLTIDRSTGQLVATTIDPASGELQADEYKAGYTHRQPSAAMSWTIAHNRGSARYVVQVFDSNNKQVIPNNIETVNASTIQVDFKTPQSGHANVVFFDATLTYRYYDVSVSIASTMEQNETLAIQPAPSQSTIDPQESYAYAKISDNVELPILINGSRIGVVQFTLGDSIGKVIIEAPVTILKDDIIEINAPSTSTTLTTVGIRLRFLNNGI